MMTEIPSCILSHYLWYNANIQIDKTPIHFSRFSEKYISYVSQLFNHKCSIKKWHKLYYITTEIYSILTLKVQINLLLTSFF